MEDSTRGLGSLKRVEIHLTLPAMLFRFDVTILTPRADSLLCVSSQLIKERYRHIYIHCDFSHKKARQVATGTALSAYHNAEGQM